MSDDRIIPGSIHFHPDPLRYTEHGKDALRRKLEGESAARAGKREARCLITENERLKSALAAAAEDTARLDWLQDDDQLVDLIYLDDGRVIDVCGLNLRAAIDAARKEAL